MGLRNKAFASVLFLTAVLATTAGASQPTVTINGFLVTDIGNPRSDVLPVPTSTSGQVAVVPGGSVYCADDPFNTAKKLRGVSPYIAVENGSVTFAPPQPARFFTLLWGSPDPWNVVSFYDVKGLLIGAVNGAEIKSAFTAIGAPTTDRILSPRKFKTVIMTSTTCAFEFSNISIK